MPKIVNGRELPYMLEVVRHKANISVTNWTEDNDMDANGAVAVVGDTLGTLIKRLQDAGIMQGTVAA